jgi:hypothetical protein
LFASRSRRERSAGASGSPDAQGIGVADTGLSPESRLSEARGLYGCQ